MKGFHYLGLFFFVIFSGCGLTGKETTPPAAGIYIVNASPDAPAIDVALNGNTLASAYGYGKDSGYFFTAPGTYPLAITQTVMGNTLLDQLLNLPAGKYYSLYMVDSFSAAKLLFIEDKLTADTFSTAKVRLFDFCPNSPVLRAIFANTNKIDTLAFSSRSFNDQGTEGAYTNFSVIPAGTYNLSLYQTDSTLIKDMGNLNFTGGKYYTVYLKGLVDNIVTPLDTAVIVH